MDAIDLNTDVGESFGTWTLGDDAALMASVSSANVACGFHGGDPSIIRRTCELAVSSGVTIGAHPGYRDLAGFGRRFMDIAPAELTNDVIYQIGAVQALAASVGGTVEYVKPHGALYNTIAHDERQADAIVQALSALDANLPLVVLPGSAIQRIAEKAGLRTVPEGFADRAYNADGTLVSRRLPGAVRHDIGQVVEQVLGLVKNRTIRAVDGTLIEVDVQTLCFHGDTPGSASLAAAVRSALGDENVRVESFV